MQCPAQSCQAGQVIPLCADGVGTNEIMRPTGKSKICVSLWQGRFMLKGLDGLLRHKARPSRAPALSQGVAELVDALTRQELLGAATR